MQEVKNTQDRIHDLLVQQVDEHEREVLEMISAVQSEEQKQNPPNQGVPVSIVQKLTEFTNAKGEYIMNEWRSLLPRLITT